MRSDLQVASITLSRSSAPVEVRERLTLQNWDALLAPFTSTMREWTVLTTCHRFELYLAAASEQLLPLCNQLHQMLNGVLGSVVLEGSMEAPEDGTGDQDPWLVRIGADAAGHLCRVAAGLDSLVLGEAQIQGQVISTYTDGLESGSIGPALSSLFRAAIRVGKRARTESQISAHAVSMSSMALSVAARRFPHFANVSVLVIGAGEMSRLALKALLQRRVTNVTVANRTLSRAQAALMHPQWRAVELARLPESLSGFDLIFSATSSPDYVVTRPQIERATGNGEGPTTQVLIDLAVPRDIDPALRTLPHVVLVDVDDLRQGLDQSLDNRKQALPVVHDIISEELERWQAQQREISVRPYVVELRRRAEQIRQAEVERTLRFIGGVDAETSEHIQHLSHALVNKLLHEPTVRIKELAHNDEVEAYLSTVCDIFGLHVTHPVLANSEDNQTNASLRSTQSAT